MRAAWNIKCKRCIILELVHCNKGELLQPSAALATCSAALVIAHTSSVASKTASVGWVGVAARNCSHPRHISVSSEFMKVAILEVILGGGRTWEDAGLLQLSGFRHGRS